MSMVLAKMSLVYLFFVKVLICAKSNVAKWYKGKKQFGQNFFLPKLAKQNQYTAQQANGSKLGKVSFG
jgi:hypothetical protein